MKQELFLFVRPPRPLWPFNGPSTAFWPPLAFASLAAALREAVREIEVRILDAPALHMGWRTLEREIHDLRPAWVGLGEEAVSAAEGLRLARMARSAGARVLAGGCFFSHVAEEVLSTGLIDVVVHGEGEVTLVEALAALRQRDSLALRKVRGISFRDGDSVVFTGARPLLEDLDRLPLPAWDLLPLECYGERSRNHPHLATAELSRGCTGSCSFCVLWRQMGQPTNGTPRPRLRIKSPERALEEIRLLVKRYGRRYVAWVDPCFNAHPEAPGLLAELLLREGIRVGQSAWVRTDGLLRDARTGALETCVRSGLNEVYLGIERPDSASLQALEKPGEPCTSREALELLRRRHPEVFTVGSFIYGLEGDTPATVRGMYRLSIELGLDMVFYIPLTPLPGTPYWSRELWDPTGDRFREFDFLPSYGPDGNGAALGRTILRSVVLDWYPARIRWYLRRLFVRDSRKRRMLRHLFVRGLRFSARRALDATLGRRTRGGMYLPAWYED
jgi:anaerobic magnesium-protoporphyrin IX monomethyl ester cyclase